MSTVCILTPIVIGSWPSIASAIVGAAGAMGFSVAASSEATPVRGSGERVETEVPNSQVLAEMMARGEKIRIERPGVVVEVGVDARGRCTVCTTGEKLSRAELKKLGEEVAGRVVQQFAYHKLMTELKSRGFSIERESVGTDQAIEVRVRMNS